MGITDMTMFEQKVKDVSSFEDFKVLYEETLSKLMEYSPDQLGCVVFSEKLGLLVDSYPLFEARYDEETANI